QGGMDMLTGRTHIRYELARSFRNRVSFVFSFALPLAVFYAVASSQRDASMDGIPFPAYYMSGMAAYGALFAAFSPAGRIAIDRARGWARQVRITPLPARSYVVSKALTAYALALPTLLALDLAGLTLGVSMSLSQWLTMTGLVLVGLLPFV